MPFVLLDRPLRNLNEQALETAVPRGDLYEQTLGTAVSLGDCMNTRSGLPSLGETCMNTLSGLNFLLFLSPDVAREQDASMAKRTARKYKPRNIIYGIRYQYENN